MPSIGTITGINTVLFDLDGTLIDTNRLIIASLNHTYLMHTGAVPDRDKLIESFGRPLPEHFAHFGPEECARMVTTYRAYNSEQHDSMVGMYEGAVECLHLLKESGIAIGVVTSKGRAIATRGIRLLGGEDLFEVVVCTEDTSKHKPDPEPVLAAIGKLGRRASDCIMVGDAPADMMSASAAGVYPVAVGWSEFDPDRLVEAGAREFIASFNALGKRVLGIV